MDINPEVISSFFFEIGSEQRLSIIMHLNENHWSISALSKELEATITEVHRNFGRLQKAGFILKNLDGTYKLTNLGKIACSQIPSIALITKNKEFFENHDFGYLPKKFQERIGELNNNIHIKGFVRVLEKWKAVHKNSNEYVYNILSEVPYSKDIIDIVEEKLTNKIIIHSIFAKNAIIPEERTTIFKEKNFTKFIKDDFLQRRMIDKVTFVILLNEKESCVIFPNLEGTPDLSQMIYSSNQEFHEWCLDYFNHCWGNSTSFQESTLVT